jgi:protein-disulfide isomerase
VATPSPRSGLRAHLGIVVGVAIVAMLSVFGVAVWAIADSRNEPGPGGPTANGSSSTAPKRSADPTGGLTAGTGPVRVDVYVDYQCPPCSTFEAATQGVLTGYLSANRVTLSIHPVAFIDHRSKNRYATRAAAAVACAFEEDKLMEFHGHLLRNQPDEDTAGPTDDELVSAGRSLGLGTGFESCVLGQEKTGWVGRATSAAQSRGVSSVPAVYVNDQKVDATEADLVAAITDA